MTSVLVTYKAPDGDDAVCTTHGHRFFDGNPVELDSEADARLIEKARANPHFEVTEDGDDAVAPAKRGGARKAPEANE